MVERVNSSFVSRLPCTALLLDNAMLDGKVILGNRVTQDDEKLSEMAKELSITFVGLFLCGELPVTPSFERFPYLVIALRLVSDSFPFLFIVTLSEESDTLYVDCTENEELGNVGVRDFCADEELDELVSTDSRLDLVVPRPAASLDLVLPTTSRSVLVLLPTSILVAPFSFIANIFANSKANHRLS